MKVTEYTVGYEVTIQRLSKYRLKRLLDHLRMLSNVDALKGHIYSEET